MLHSHHLRSSCQEVLYPAADGGVQAQVHELYCKHGIESQTIIHKEHVYIVPSSLVYVGKDTVQYMCNGVICGSVRAIGKLSQVRGVMSRCISWPGTQGTSWQQDSVVLCGSHTVMQGGSLLEWGWWWRIWGRLGLWILCGRDWIFRWMLSIHELVGTCPGIPLFLEIWHNPCLKSCQVNSC